MDRGIKLAQLDDDLIVINMILNKGKDARVAIAGIPVHPVPGKDGQTIHVNAKDSQKRVIELGW